jgi:hypothetical protein
MKTKLFLILTFLTTFFVQSQEINVRQGTTDYASGATFNFADTQLNAVTTSITFTVQNLSAPNLLISGASPRVEISGVDADQFVVSGVLNSSIANGGNDTFAVQFRPTTLGAKSAVMTILSNDADEGTYTIDLAGNSIVNRQSTISLPSLPNYVYTPTIPYENFQAADITSAAAGFEIITFRINDIVNAAANAENLPTILTDLTLSISNAANIRRIALYDDVTELAEEDGAASVVFSGLELTAPAGSTKTFRVLVTFNETVTDNQNISIGITAATADPAGSNFTATNAGGAVSSTSTTVNRIVVTATALNFVENPSNTDTFVAMAPAVTVEAVDALGNRDLNYATAVILTTSGTFHSSGPAPITDANNNASAGLATFPSLVHGALGTGLLLTANSGSLTSANSLAFDIATASAATNFYRSAANGDWNNVASWETSGNNVLWTASTLVPNAVSSSIVIRAGHIITVNSTEVGDQITIASAGTLRIVSGGTLNVNNGSGWDLTVTGTLEYAGGNFTQSAAVAMRVTGNNTGNYIHSIPSATLVLPRFTWSTGTTCSITGLTNAVPIIATNMDQNFSRLVWNNPGQSDFVTINSDLFRVSSTLTLGASAANRLCIASSGSHTNIITAVTINGGTLTGFSGTASGTLTMSGLTITNGTFIGNNSNGSTTINNTGTITISTNGQYIASNNAGTVTASVNAITLNNNGNLTLISSASSGDVTFNFASTNRDLNISGTSSVLLESVSSAGVAIMNVSRNVNCSSTATPAIDFGTGNATGNLISLKGGLTKTGTGIVTTSSTSTESTGFVFNGSGAQANQNINFTGTASSGVNYTANNTGTFGFSNSFVFGTSPSTQRSIFTINAATLNLGGSAVIGNATLAQFNIAAGVNVLTSSAGGLGGVSTTGSFRDFTSIGNTPADGRVVFGTNSNYTFSGSTVTPFPTGGTWVTPNNVTVNNNITINYTTPFTLNGTLTVNSPRTLRLNPTSGAHLNLIAPMVVNGAFDVNGTSNQIIDAGGSPSIVINGTFVTRDPEGFTGPNASIPTIIPTLGSISNVNYAGTSQIITDAAYQNLIISGTLTKTLGSNVITALGGLDVTTTTLLRVQAGQTLSIADRINTVSTTNARGIVVENNGSLVQVNNVANSGNVRVIRLTTPVYRNDYTYWSSPLTEASGFTLFNLSPNTMFNKYLRWNFAGATQSWQIVLNGVDVMTPGSGYIVRPPITYALEGAADASPENYTATFFGVPNNGDVTHPISGSTTVNRYNLLGNPYPSALEAEAFLDANPALGGTLYFWTHNSMISTSTFAYGTSDYASWSSTGGVATTAGEGVINISEPTGNIASGQSFFVKGVEDGLGTATFNNTMRRSVAGINNQFFRQNETETIEKNRVWLNLQGETQGFNQTLVGYITNATNAYDRRYDSESFGGNQVTFYSIAAAKNLVIQGRALPFTVADTVSLGYKSTITNNLTISIDHLDGLFADQAIYLKDNVLNVEHDLKATPYTFSTAIGTFNNRFVLQYVTQGILSNPTFEQALKGITIYKNDTDIHIKSQHETIDKVYVYDITGRLIFERMNVNTNSLDITELTTSQQTLIVKVVLKNGGISTKKVW